MPGDLSYDAIVVGAGPAGAIAAYELGRSGLRVALLEKDRLPRDKVCGGGLTAKVIDVLPFDLAPVIERTVASIELSWQLRRPVVLSSDRPLVHLVRRHRFDAFLVEQALATGRVELFEGLAATAVEALPDRAVVSTTAAPLAARFVIGADGASGPVAKSLGLMAERTLLAGIECELAVDAATMDRWRDRIAIDLGSIAGGYGWIFPKGEHLNIGVGVMLGSGSPRELTRYQREHLQRWLPRTVAQKRGSVLPLRAAGAPICRGRVLLVGDAAGLIEGFTGEGIYWALRSGQLAARAIVSSGEAEAPRRYEAAIDRELMPDLIEARRLAHLYQWLPHSVYALPTRVPAAWRGMQKILRGERRFVDVRAKLGAMGRLVGWVPSRL